MSKYNEAYKDQDLPAIIIKRDVDIVLSKLTNRDKRIIKEQTDVDLMQKFLDMQSAGAAQVNPAVDKVFEDVDKDIKEKLDLGRIKAQLNSAIPDERNEDPMSKIFSDIGAEIEHLLFKLSLKHDDSDIDDQTVDKIIADLEPTEYVRALMWFITGRDMNEEEAEEIAEKADDSGNFDTLSKTEDSAKSPSK